MIETFGEVVETDTELMTCCSGLYTPDDDLAQDLDLAAKVAGELLWRMPLVAA